MSNPNAPPYYQDLARTGVIIIFLFMLDGIKIEQMRLNLADYWHFFFGICGVLLAACNQVEDTPKTAAQDKQNDTELVDGGIKNTSRVSIPRRFYRSTV